MMIFQFQFEKLTEQESQIIEGFKYSLLDNIKAEIYNPMTILKIKLRIPYLYTVRWISWFKKELTVPQILERIEDSFKLVHHRNNVYVLEVDNSVRIPNTNTSMGRLLRFLEYGDLKYKGINIFKKLEHKYNWSKLNSMWALYCLQHLR